MPNTIEIKNNRLYLNNKLLPTNVNEFIGEIILNNMDFFVIKLQEINIYSNINQNKKQKGISKIEKIKIIKPIPNLFMDIEPSDIVKITTIYVKDTEMISDQNVINKSLLLNTKKL